MRKRHPVILAVGALLGLIAATASAAQVAQVATPERYRLRVDTPPLRVEAADQGYVRLELEGYDARFGGVGAPELPARTILVAIPRGAKPRLLVSPAGSVETRQVRPVPFVPARSRLSAAELGVGVPHVDPEPAESVPAPRRFEEGVAFGREAMFPEQSVWLGEVGRMRDQDYVAVHIAPVRWNGARGAVEIRSAVEFTVEFDGYRSEGPEWTDPGEHDRFEAVYRQAFVNYEQGRRFRFEARATAPAPAPVAAAGIAGPRHKLTLESNGFVRLDHAFLATHAADLLPIPVANWRLESQGEPVPLQIHQIPGGGFDETLIDRPGEYVQFYGQAYDLEEPSTFVGFGTGMSEPLYAMTDNTDRNVYFLSGEATSQAAMPEREAAPGAEPSAGGTFIATSHAEEDDLFLPYSNLPFDYWLPLATESAPLVTKSVPLPGLADPTAPLDVRVQVRGAGECVQYCSNLMDPGSCVDVDDDHKSGISLANGLAETLELPAGNPDNQGNENVLVFDGSAVVLHEFSWTHGIGQPEASDPLDVTLRAFDVPGLCTEPASGQVRNDLLIDWIEVDYERSFSAVGDRLEFSRPDGPAVRVEIDGFSGPEVEVYEITAFAGSSLVRSPVRLTGTSVQFGGSDYSVEFRIDEDPALLDGSTRTFVAIGPGGALTPPASDLEPDRVSTLASDTSQADLVVIAHPDLIESSCSMGGNACSYDLECVADPADRCEVDPASSLGQLLAHRAGQGITSRVARIGDVYDEFGDGLARPEAIRSFLSFLAEGGWQAPAPAFVLLLGDGNVDYKGGTESGNFVPTQIITKPDFTLAFYASDSMMAAVLGDDAMPDLVVGRIPARTQAEADITLDKLVGYDTATPAGAWRSNALLISDRANDFTVTEALDFEQVSQDAIDEMQIGPYSAQRLRYWSDYCDPDGDGNPACTPNAARDDIEDALNGFLDPGVDGAALVQFAGHGNFFLWSSDVLFCTNDELAQFPPDGPGITACAQTIDQRLTNGLRLPFLMVHNCLSGGFHTNPRSFGRQFLLYDGGGAMGVLAPSGLGSAAVGKKLAEPIWETMFGNRKEREIAVPVLASYAELCASGGFGDLEACQFYIFLGDPSARVSALPDVDPASGLAALAGNAVVDLDWSASATPGATYYVYRVAPTSGMPNTYVPLVDEAGPGIAATTFQDSSVINAIPYRYYVVARDPAGFESAWSNFNDCGAPGPDCVEAMPINPIPPAKVTGGFAVDLEIGNALRVDWSPSPEIDVDFYTLHWGPTPAFGQTQTFGSPGPLPVLVPPTGTLLTGFPEGEPVYFAVTATNTSGLTSVISDTFVGIPTLVLGIRPPKPVIDLRIARSDADAELEWSPVTENIYGGAAAGVTYEVFRATSFDFVPGPGTLLAEPVAPGHTDPGVIAPGPDYFYLVRAVDGAGLLSGVGRQLPEGVRDLTVTLGPGEGEMTLAWGAVTEDLDGAPTSIGRYELWSGSTPVSRADIESESATLVDGNITETSITIPLPAGTEYYSILAVDVRGNRSPY